MIKISIAGKPSTMQVESAFQGMIEKLVSDFIVMYPDEPIKLNFRKERTSKDESLETVVMVP